MLDALLDVPASVFLYLSFALNGQVLPFVQPHSALIFLGVLQLLEDLHLIFELLLELLLLQLDLIAREAMGSYR